MWRHVFLSLALFSAVGGCANLEVKKVSEAKREAGEDHVKGFRYYLARPYVVVKAPVLVSESSTLYVVSDRPTAPGLSQSLPPPGVEQVCRINPASGAFENVSDAELNALRLLVAEPGGVRQVGHKTAPLSAPVVVQQAAPPGLTGLIQADAAAGDAGNAVAAGVVEVADQSGGSKSSGTPSADSAPLTIPAVTADPTPVAPPLEGDIQIIFLPDMDEQYAVHNCNFLSKSGYQLYFKDGWQLTNVSGEFDSTAVPLEILNFIDTAINSAKNVAIAGIDQQARILGGDVADRAPALAAGRTVYQVVTSTYLKPGVYRINKPWECRQDHPATGCGLLAMMGLATYETTRVQVNPDLRALSDIRHDCMKK
jgi:hypothetical protein